nr:nicotinamide-nucleotide amidohydrolase family protein [Candidatus Halocynthiibacter alkanivorans]
MSGVRQQILARALKRGLRITAAESCTGGGVAQALTDLPGSSAMFEYGFVTYSNAAKTAMLGVSADSLANFGAVSEQVAREMADGALQRAGADIAVAISGIAGPGGSDFKPEGRVCFALAVKTAETTTDIHAETVEFTAIGRKNVRVAACQHALALVLRAL